MNQLVKAIRQSCTEVEFRHLLETEISDPQKYKQQEWHDALFAVIDEKRDDLLALLHEYSNTEHKLLLDEPLWQKDSYSDYPLELAIKKGSATVVQKLIDFGANVNLASHSSKKIPEVGSFLHLAVLKTKVNTARIIKILLENGIKRHWADPINGINMACTLALEQGTIDDFLEAANGRLSPDEALELLCKHYQDSNQGSKEALIIEELVENDKIIKIETDAPSKQHFEEEKTEFLLSSQANVDFLSHFPPLEAWRLFVDGEKQTWYDLAFMSEIKADKPTPGKLYLSINGDSYLTCSLNFTHPPKEGSLIDLSDLKLDADSNRQRLAQFREAFLAFKADPKQDLKLKQLILDLMLERGQIQLPKDTYQPNAFFRVVVTTEENGWCGYEKREPACINNMYRAFELACLSKEELSPAFIARIHKLAMDHNKTFKDEFNLEAHYSLVPQSNLSLLGYLELCKEPYSNWNDFSWTNAYRRLKVYKKIGCPRDIEQLINQYKQAQRDTKPEDREQQLKNIILLSSGYARLHPREDGNNRTAVILLNSELIKHGFLPVILEDPNRLEGFSQKELLEEVYQGMQNLRYVMQHGHYPGGKTTLDYQNAVSSPPLKKIPETIAASFDELMHTMQDNVTCPKRN